MLASVLGLLQRLPGNVINGLCVSLGVASVHLSLVPFVSSAAVMAATSGAVYASLPHGVDRAGRAARRALAGGIVGSVTTLIVVALLPSPLLLHLAMGLVVFLAMLALAWGQRAGPISFVAVLAIVFSLATGATLPPLHFALWTFLGGVLYALSALLSTRLLDERLRTLSVAAALQACVQLLRSRADVLEQLDAADGGTATRWKQIDEEARLAVQLQSARELVFAGTERPRGVPHAQLLFRAIELRDLVLTSRLDLDLLGEDALAREIRSRLARSLRANALALEQADGALRFGYKYAKGLPSLRGQSHVKEILDERTLPGADPRLRLLPAIASRQQQLLDLIASLHDLLRGHHAHAPLSTLDRARLLANESWPLSVPLQQLSWQSPVFRHALRSALAFMGVHALATALPWATHPHWIVLSVAVVLRGNFAQTLSRRNERIVGTAIGCVLAAGAVSVAPEVVLSLILFVAVGVAHAYVNVRYTLTAAAATLMALLQTRLQTAITPFVVLERLADTVLGAGFAWAFSFVLPSWSRRALPAQLASTLAALRGYAERAVVGDADADGRQQLAREQAYEALESLSSTVRLSAVEPRRVRPPLRLFLSFIDHAQGLMAHLSSLRLLLVRRAEQLQGQATEAALEEARRRLCKRLDLQITPHHSRPPLHAIQLEPPSVPADRAAFPWLMRRINISVHEAERTGDTARAALAELRGAESLTDPSRSPS